MESLPPVQSGLELYGRAARGFESWQGAIREGEKTAWTWNFCRLANEPTDEDVNRSAPDCVVGAAARTSGLRLDCLVVSGRARWRSPEKRSEGETKAGGGREEADAAASEMQRT